MKVEPPHVAFANLRMDIREMDERLSLSRRKKERKKAFAQFVHRWGKPICITTSRKGYAARTWNNNHLRGAWAGNNEYVNSLPNYLHATFRVTGRRIEMTPANVVSLIVLLFMRDYAAGKTAICANPECPNPFFIRKRRTQKYCEAGPCVAKAQRAHKREWWRRNRGKGADE